MIELVPITKEAIKNCIEIAFNGDVELLESLHISPGTLEHCVDHTFSLIIANDKICKGDVKYYAVSKDENIVGYSVVIVNPKYTNELYSFGININYRTKEIVQQWLGLIEELLGLPFYIILWSKNKRALDFFKKNGFDQDMSDSFRKEQKTLIFKK